MDINTNGLNEARAMLGHLPGAVEKAAARAINRAVTAAKTAAARETAAQYYEKQKDVKATLSTTKATAQRPVAALMSKGSRVPLSSFKTTPQNVPRTRAKSPIKVQVKRSGSGGSIRNAFLTRFKSGHKAVARRLTKKRLPINELYGPAVPQMLAQQPVTDTVAKRVEMVLAERMEHEVEAVLKGYTK